VLIHAGAFQELSNRESGESGRKEHHADSTGVLVDLAGAITAIASSGFSSTCSAYWSSCRAIVKEGASHLPCPLC
jgi:hypothetical protein